MLTTLNKLGKVGNYLNIIKWIYEKTTANIILKVNLNFSYKTRQEVLSLLFNVILKILVKAIRLEKVTNGIRIRKKTKIYLYS